MEFYTSVHKRGNSILYRGYKNGRKIQNKVEFSPKLYVKTDSETADSKSLHGVSLREIRFTDINAAAEFVRSQRDIDNSEIYGNTNFVCQFIGQQFPDNIEFNIKWIDISTIDIETKSDSGFPEPDKADQEITAITYKSRFSNIYHVWGRKEYDFEKTILKLDGKLIQYHKHEDELMLLQSFIKYFNANSPDILTGWNIRGFDVPYLINRITNVLGESWAKKLSPWGVLNSIELKLKWGTIKTYELLGIQQLDYIDLFKKFGYVYGKQESYKLDHIAYVVLDEKKLSYDEYSNLTNLYNQNHQLFIDYNIKDVQLVEKLEDRLGLIELVLIMAYRGGVNYTDTLGTTAIWDSIIYRKLLSKNLVIPPAKEAVHAGYEGGFVKDPKPGKYKWVASFDLNSLYPLTIVQYNSSPETIINDKRYISGVEYYMKNDVESEYSVMANGVPFSKKTRGIFPEIIEEYYADRSLLKKKMLELKKQYEINKSDEIKAEMNKLDNSQTAVKILLNSFYGALGSKYFRYFDLRIAEGITLSGQLAIHTAEYAINSFLNKHMKTNNFDYAFYLDTDSCYVNFEKVIEMINPKDPLTFIDKLCNTEISKVIQESYDKLFVRMNAYKNVMAMKREAIASSGIWTGKKRYILNVLDNEGVRYAEPKLKMMGIEAVKSSTPQIIRDKFKDTYKLILSSDEKTLQKYVKDFETQFKLLKPEEIAFPRGITEINKWKDEKTTYKSGCPIHVRASILYNQQIEQHNLNIEPIKDSGRLKYVYLKLPNILKENVIGFIDYLPLEFNIEQYIDYDLQFTKTYKEPLLLITNAIGWSIEKVDSLDAFFE